MGLVDDYLSAYKVGKKRADGGAHGVFYQRVCGCHMGANDTGS